jgi:hypothetical protein
MAVAFVDRCHDRVNIVAPPKLDSIVIGRTFDVASEELDRDTTFKPKKSRPSLAGNILLVFVNVFLVSSSLLLYLLISI